MFKTEFICILTAGHTVDGREVSQQTLNEIAETYDPEKYNARINVNHSLYSSKLGSVLAVKVDGAKLLAQLKPNDLFLYLIQQGQYLHTSCEIVGDFAKTGKAYLTGLAVTDEPASLGTTELHLSAQQTQTGAELYCTSEAITPEKPTLLNKLFNKKDDPEMTDKATLEMLTQMQETNAAQVTALTALSTGITSLTVKLTAKAPEADKPPSVEETEKTALQAVTDKLATLTDKFAEQQTTIAGLTEKLSKVSDEPERNQATGGDGDNLDDVL
jgi:hypothetical protein